MCGTHTIRALWEHTPRRGQARDCVRGLKVREGQQVIGYVHHNTGCGFREILCRENRKNVEQDIILWVPGFLFSQKREVPARKNTATVILFLRIYF